MDVSHWARLNVELGSYCWVQGNRVWPIKRLPSNEDAGKLGAFYASFGHNGGTNGSIGKCLSKLCKGAEWPILVGFRHRGRDRWITYDESGWIGYTRHKHEAYKHTNVDMLGGTFSWLMGYTGQRALFFEAVNLPAGAKEAHEINEIQRSL